jgi:uncharacterized protein YegP (UPF0339 family)
VITYPTGDGDTVEVYEGADGWRWRVRAGNGRIIATAGEAFASKRSAARAARRVYPEAADRSGDPYAPPEVAR